MKVCYYIAWTDKDLDIFLPDFLEIPLIHSSQGLI